MILRAHSGFCRFCCCVQFFRHPETSTTTGKLVSRDSTQEPPVRRSSASCCHVRWTNEIPDEQTNEHTHHMVTFPRKVQLCFDWGTTTKTYFYVFHVSHVLPPANSLLFDGWESTTLASASLFNATSKNCVPRNFALIQRWDISLGNCWLAKIGAFAVAVVVVVVTLWHSPENGGSLVMVCDWFASWKCDQMCLPTETQWWLMWLSCVSNFQN